MRREDNILVLLIFSAFMMLFTTTKTVEDLVFNLPFTLVLVAALIVFRRLVGRRLER